MSMLLRAAPLRVAARRQAFQVRNAHFENVVDHTIPGNTRNKAGMAAKMITYTICGFGLPFVSANESAKRSAWCVQDHMAGFCLG
ncbi:hypothetical protein A1Q2_02970 [Trichosporon asahii var. asahii CBS 8904]|uniref:Cytochrome c oxidase subunit 8, mitochondrial n=2 Tax=Trichosporon asahii var. asahii TaxID=189963 RepID=K1VFC1_TRIAC|nr:hypothetical protein A1Q1_06971 [Trichosporon asahii var. asahii CBS 2479]EJT51740.1 hypothetical protein A1Q1_06971 [Trichosporon asahii var. asahii CBS 2479]EKD02740.1 hypothetical protein A1Q2_02970 [Trichosporon asahii var. asahii CBS 8904]